MRKIYFLVFLFVVCQFQTTVAMEPPKQDFDFDMSIRYHGNRIHVKVIPRNTELHTHIVEIRLCSAVDLNIEDSGCNTPGFVSETLVSAKSSRKVEPNKFDTRLSSSGTGLSFKPIQVIDNWPLVYVETKVRMKIPGKGWAANGKIVRNISRIDKANANAGRAIGMVMIDAQTPIWRWYVVGAILGSFALFAIIGMIHQKIARTRKKIRRDQLYSRNGIYQFSGGPKGKNNGFKALYEIETVQEQERKKDKKIQDDMEIIGIENGMLVEEEDYSKWM